MSSETGTIEGWWDPAEVWGISGRFPQVTVVSGKKKTEYSSDGKIAWGQSDYERDTSG